MNDSREYKTNPPLRFRQNIDSMDAYIKPSGPLPVLNMQQTSLVGNSPRQMGDNPPRPTNPDDDHKTEIERMRNKQRQRDHIFAADGGRSSTMTSSMNNNNNSSWRREQEKINAILDPQANE